MNTPLGRIPVKVLLIAAIVLPVALMIALPSRAVGIAAGFILGYGALLVIIPVILVTRWLARRGEATPPPVDHGIPRPASMMAPAVLRPSFAVPTLGDVLTLTARQFEELCLDLLMACGFPDLMCIGKSGDLGADITGHDRQGRYMVCQCKRYGPGVQVGSPAVQSFIGMMTVQHKAERGVFVTSSVFSLPAVQLAKAHGVTLIDGACLLTLMALTGVGCPANVSAQPVQTPTMAYAPSPAFAGVQPSMNGGHRVEANVVAHAPKFCTSCGSAIEEGAVFCADCGAKVKHILA